MRRGAIAMICAEAAQIVNDEDFSIAKQLEELEEVMIELELQARAQIEILEIFNFSLLDLLTQSKHIINAIRRKRVRVPSALWIKKSWKVKTTIRGRLPHY